MSIARRIFNTYSRRALLCLLLAVAAVTAAEARIFSGRSASHDIPGLLETLGGRVAYSAPVQINGAPATLTVIGFDDPRDTRAADIRAALKLDPPAPGNDALHIITDGDRVTRLLLFRPGDQTVQTLAVLIEQTAAAFRKSRDHSGGGRVSPLPLYPGARPGLVAGNGDTGLSFATLTADAAPEQVAAFYRTTLMAEGWQPMFPDADAAGSCLFLRENALCYVLITKAEESAVSHITLLHKPLKNSKP